MKREDYCGNFGVLEVLRKRMEELEKELRERKRALEGAVPGKIHIKMKKTPEFYVRTDPKERTGRYLKRSEGRLIRKLLQKRYDEEWVGGAEEELAFLKAFAEAYSDFNREALFSSLPERAKRMVEAREMSDEDYTKRWLDEPYEGLGFRENAPEFYTAKGERVRSKSEVMIADLLVRMGLPYRYEFPLKLKSGYTVHPDFTILDVRHRRVFYLEHLGMMDDREYARDALKKINDYKASGYYPCRNLLLTHETSASPLNLRLVEAEIREMLR